MISINQQQNWGEKTTTPIFWTLISSQANPGHMGMIFIFYIFFHHMKNFNIAKLSRKENAMTEKESSHHWFAVNYLWYRIWILCGYPKESRPPMKMGTTNWDTIQTPTWKIKVQAMTLEQTVALIFRLRKVKIYVHIFLHICKQTMEG